MIGFVELFIAGAAAIGFWVGWTTSEKHTRKTLLEYVDQARGEQGVPSGIDPTVPVIQIKVEQIDGQLFAYQLSNGMFLGQANDGETLVAKLSRRWAGQDVHVTIHKEDGAEHVEQYFPKG